MVSRVLLLALAPVALIATVVALALNSVLAQALQTSITRINIVAAIASVLQSLVLVTLLILIIGHYQSSLRNVLAMRRNIWFTLGVVAVMLASIASGATLVCLSQITGPEQDGLQFDPKGYLIGFVCTLCFTFIVQLGCVAAYFAGGRLGGDGPAFSFHVPEEGYRSPEMLMRVKAVPYTKTVAAPPSIWRPSGESRPCSSGGRSASETVSSIRTSLSHVVRPITSRTHLLSSRSSRSGLREVSVDIEANRGQSGAGPDGFDSWDTSSVEAPNRGLGIDTSFGPITRFLETIPASPMTSRSPSPGNALDLEPVRKSQPGRNRSRSYSPSSKTPSPQALPRPDEAHIHPLFRSDSPIPPPAATPGTVVIASPNAGQTISERSLSRMRSSSLNGTPRNLSRQASYESFQRKTPSPNGDAALVESVEETDMAPPIPAWILSAGSRSSLHEYQTRKMKESVVVLRDDNVE